MKEAHRRGLIILGGAISAITMACFSVLALILAIKLFRDGFCWSKFSWLIFCVGLGITCCDRGRRLNKLYMENRP